MSNFILGLTQIEKGDDGLVGERAVELAALASFDLPILPGFVITSDALRYFFRGNSLDSRVRGLWKFHNLTDPLSLVHLSKQVHSLFESVSIPKELASEIVDNYFRLTKLCGISRFRLELSFAPERSPAPQLSKSLLGLAGETVLLERIKDFWMSLFTPHFLKYLIENREANIFPVSAVIVQVNPETEVFGEVDSVYGHDRNLLSISTWWGNAHREVKEKLVPDHYLVQKTPFLLKDQVVVAQKMFIRMDHGIFKKMVVSEDKINRKKMSDSQIAHLSKLCLDLEKNFYFPFRVDFELSGGKIFLTKVSPLTHLEKTPSVNDISQQTGDQNREFKRVQGIRAAPGRRRGTLRHLKSPQDFVRVNHGDIIYLSSVHFSSEILRKASGIIVRHSEKHSEALFACLKAGKPCIIGVGEEIVRIKDGQVVTIDGTTGEIVYL